MQNAQVRGVKSIMGLLLQPCIPKVLCSTCAVQHFNSASYGTLHVPENLN